jgi:hypothetical protein
MAGSHYKWTVYSWELMEDIPLPYFITRGESQWQRLGTATQIVN